MTDPVPKGSVLGVLGKGQLGRMFVHAAHAIGYKVWVYGPGSPSPAGQVADREFDAEYSNQEALAEFTRGVRTVTVEFENIPREALERMSAAVPVHPSPEVLHIAQHRLREKNWLSQNGFPLADYVWIRDRSELSDALEAIGTPAVLKTTAFGYDGKGQATGGLDDLERAWDAMNLEEAVVEQFIAFERELSVVCARNLLGQTRCFPVCHNRHHKHVLAVTRAPADLPPDQAHKAQAMAMQIAQALRVVGLVTVEYFLTRDGELLVNELAPRPHNSGHFSIDACDSSQFAHHVLAITNRPLPVVTQRAPAMMANLLGDLWAEGEPPFDAMAALPGAHLHLYGKTDPAARRKMGHLTVVGQIGPDLEETVVRLGVEQTFVPPRPPSGAERLAGQLAREPFQPFSVFLSDGRQLTVDEPTALGHIRGKFLFESKDGELVRFDPDEIRSIAEL